MYSVFDLIFFYIFIFELFMVQSSYDSYK